MSSAISRILRPAAAGVMVAMLATVPLGAASARGMGGGGMGGGGMHGGGMGGGMHGGGWHGGGMPWIHGGGGWHGGPGWHGAGWGPGWHGGRYGWGYNNAWPFVGGVAAGALLTAPYGYDNGYGYYDDGYGYANAYSGNCRNLLVRRGPAGHRYYVQRTVCD